MATKTTAVATQPKGGAIAAYDYGEHAGSGFENISSADLLIPFLTILQPTSPQVTEGDGSLQAGLFLNTVTGEFYEGEKGVPFQPVDFQHMFVEWVPREKGGGIAGRYLPEDELVVAEVAKNNNSVVGIKLSNGNELIETYYVYGNILNEAGTEVEGFAVLAVKSTSIKPMRGWLTAMRMVKGKPPLFAFRALLKNNKQKNDAGVWWQLDPKPLGSDWRASLIDPTKDGSLLEAAVSLQEMIRSGKASADFTREDRSSGAAGGDPDKAPF